MEIHQHPEVEKKGFTEYLLEGLMIFIAVTMGDITVKKDPATNIIERINKIYSLGDE